MMKKIFFYLGFFLFFITILSTFCFGAAQITATGMYTDWVDEADLESGPGSNLISTYTSASNANLLSISTSLGAWTVSVRRADNTWNANFRLYVRRTGDGTGSGTISGGTNWLEVTTSNQVFFTGSLDRSDIPIQYQLTGMSLSITPANFRTTVTWMVYGP